MNIIIALLIVDTIVQLLLCHISFWWLVVLIVHLIFCARMIGVTVPVKTLCIAEGVTIGCMIVWDMIFSSENFPWLSILLFCGLSAIGCFLMLLDDVLYVYIVKDEDQDE